MAIATYERADVLLRCLRLAVEQTRPPSEVVVVDASRAWDKTRDQVMDELAAAHANVGFNYVKAEMARQTAQRNQAIALASADVLFMIDDDSLMYPTCAEALMRAYEVSDAIVAAQAELHPAPPDEPGSGRAADQQSSPLYDLPLVGTLAGAANVRLKGSFFPPGATQPDFEMPTVDFPLTRVDRLHGARFTVRRSVAAQEGFDANIAQSIHEDSEASWRFARHGLLVEVGEPLIHHAVAVRVGSNTRRGAYQRAFWLLNHAYITRKLFPDRDDAPKYIRGYGRGTRTLDLLLGLPRRDLSKYRGGKAARDAVEAVIEASDDDLAEVYATQAARVREQLG